MPVTLRLLELMLLLSICAHAVGLFLVGHSSRAFFHVHSQSEQCGQSLASRWKEEMIRWMSVTNFRVQRLLSFTEEKKVCGDCTSLRWLVTANDLHATMI
jgi:hypothetical protein